MVPFAEALCGLCAAEDPSEGQGLIEYALIVALIAVAVIVALVVFRGQIVGLYSRLGNSLSGS